MRRRTWLVAGAVCAISTAAMSQGQQPKLDALLGGAPRSDVLMARPAPKARIYGGTEDLRWISEVQAMLEAKAQQMPPLAGTHAGAKLALCFRLDATGRPFGPRICGTTGNRPLEAFARRVLAAAAPFPPPPAQDANRELNWVYSYERQLNVR